MSIEVLPIVTIQTSNGPVDINESDYDPAKHNLAGASKAPAKTEAPAKTPDAPKRRGRPAKAK